MPAQCPRRGLTRAGTGDTLLVMALSAPTAGLSSLQRRTLAVLANTVQDGLPSQYMYGPLLGVAIPTPTFGGPRSKTTIPATARASLARSLTRLQARGLIGRAHRGFYVLTADGRTAAGDQGFDRQCLDILPKSIRGYWFGDPSTTVSNPPTLSWARKATMVSNPSTLSGSANRSQPSSSTAIAGTTVTTMVSNRPTIKGDANHYEI